MAKPLANLTPQQVVERWDGAITVGTLANWRAKGKGPTFIKFGVWVRYPIVELEKWEAENTHHANDNEQS